MIGQTISHYRILEKLGGGGMGVVYRAEDLKLRRTVALKFLPPELTRDDDAKKRFVREARAASALDHNNICTIHEIEETPEGQLFICMAHYDGETLKEKLERGSLSVGEAIHIACSIAKGLAKAHGEGMVHRDIKPANIMVTKDGVVKIVDFGLATLAGLSKITKTGTTVGTAPYMSPEQVRGDEVDHRSDIWSLGVLLYEMLTCQTPFKGSYDPAIFYSIINDDFEPLSNARFDVQASLEIIVNKALMKSALERYQHIDDMLVDLRAASREMKGKTRVASSTKSLGRWLLPLGFTVVLAGVAGLTLSRMFFFNSGDRDRRSVAVLPFENMSRSADNEYFSDGITEDIITQLSKISDLRVISRTSSMSYKNTDKSLREIGKELGVATVLEGSVRKEGDEVRITAQLIDAETDQHIWAERYDRKLTSIFAIQGDVAQHIAAALEAALSPMEIARIKKEPTVSLEAYDLYLRGRFHWKRRNLEDYERSIQYYKEAIEKDPSYALAYAGLADSYLLLQLWLFRAPNEVMPKAEAAAATALELDDNLAEAHTSLAAVRHWYLWDWEGAEAEYQRAIELNPSYATAHHWYAFFLKDMDRLDEAAAEIHRAHALDPLSLIINVNVGLIAYAYAGDYDAAIQQILKVVETDPSFLPAHERLAVIYGLAGRFDEAAEEYVKTYEMMGWINEEHVATWRRVYEIQGWAGLQGWFLQHLLERADITYVEPVTIASKFAELDRKDEALEWFNKAFEQRSSELTALKTHPRLDNLRDDPRFKELLQRIGLD